MVWLFTFKSCWCCSFTKFACLHSALPRNILNNSTWLLNIRKRKNDSFRCVGFFFSGRAYSFSKGLYTFNSIHIFHYFRGNKSSPTNIELSHSKFVWCCCCCCCFLEFLLLMHTRIPIKYHHSYPFSLSVDVLDIVVGESQMSTLYLIGVLLLPHC